MNESAFEIALINLQNTQENGKLLKILIGIRKEVDWPCNKDNIRLLREKKCLKYIVSALQSTQKAILDVSLSILGNCCLDRGCTRDIVSQHNILSILNHLCKRHAKEDSINGRIFRILGNMCQHRDQWANIVIDRKPNIVVHIVDFVRNYATDGNEKKISDATIVMAVRALREHLNYRTVSILTKNFGVLKAIGLLLMKCSAQWQIDKGNEEILNGIIKLLQDYSSYKYYPCITEMKNTEKGDAIVHLSKILLLAPKQIVKILMNFIEISQLKSDLPIPEIFDSFIQVLDNISSEEFSEEYKECIQCLCCLFQHPANRNNERCIKSIPTLIKILNNLNVPNVTVVDCWILIINTFSKCQYDQILIQEQLRCNVIDSLIDKFKWLIGCTKTFNTTHKNDKKRKYDVMNKKVETRSESPTSGDEFDYIFNGSLRMNCEQNYDFSPSPIYYRSPSSSSENEMVSSPWSPHLSPHSSSPTTSYISESDSDGNYSPVCSEVDNDEYQSSNFMYEEPLANNETDDCAGNSNKDESSDDSVMKGRLFVEIFELLKLYAMLKPAVPQLANPELLIALIKCSREFNWIYTFTEPIDLVCRILSSHDYLLPLMQTDFVPSVYNLTQAQHGIWCTRCHDFQKIGNLIILKITKLAESDVGKGDIAHQLLKGDEMIKQRLVLVIPYIVRNRSILGKLMLNCGGLQLLMSLIHDTSELQKKCIKGLCVLAVKKLSISNPNRRKLEYYELKKFCESNRNNMNNTFTQLVRFKLDDGNVLQADRVALSEKSEFFERLLNGDFRESKESEIVLHNVVHQTMQCLLQILNCDPDTVEVDEKRLDLVTLLDLIVLSDRFLLIKLGVCLTQYVEQCRLNTKTIAAIYKWSLESRTNLLRIECIAFALVADVSDTERYEMFEKLFELGYSDDLIEDIRTLLVRYLSLNTRD